MTGSTPASANYPLLGYAAMQSLALAVEKAGGSTKGSDVGKALETFNGQELITGPTTYTSTCHIPVGKPYLFMQVQGGKFSYTGTTLAAKKVPPAPC